MKHIEEKVVETIRFLAVDAVQKANSGHPGMPMGTATMAYTLWSRFLKGSATDVKWPDRDRFVLSAGHGSMLLYALLHLFGYEVTIDDLKNFRQLHSKTPGHPEYNVTPGVETTTGPLGQGFANAVGMAIAERRLAAEFNTAEYPIVDHYTYTIAGDGCMMEGVSQEAASLAGHLKLGKLIALYDSNHITIDGSTDLSMSEDVGKRFEAYGWEVFHVADGNAIGALEDALRIARIDTTKPSMIIVNTTIGYGSPNKAGKSASHGSPLGDEEVRLTKSAFGWEDTEPFFVSDEVREYMKELIDKREIERFMWEEMFEEYAKKHPEKAKQWTQWHEFEIPEGLESDPQIWNLVQKDDATRNAGGVVMNYMTHYLPNLMGGSADLNGSTKTYLKGMGDFSRDEPKGNNLYFGVREHAMAAVLNGLTLHGGLRVFGSTFLTFADYMKPSIRLSALMELAVTYVFTHDSIGVGEDGPTHQPIEHLLMLRSIPNMAVFRPGDAKETAIAWIEALKRTKGPSAMILTRQKVKMLEGVHKGAHAGGYILVKETGDQLDLILLATGSEVNLAVEVQKKLTGMGYGVRVVSMLCWELFDEQNEGYRNEVLPPNVENRISIEAATTLGWDKYVGLKGIKIGMESFGLSAPGNQIFEHFGFTVDHVVSQAMILLEEL